MPENAYEVGVLVSENALRSSVHGLLEFFDTASELSQRTEPAKRFEVHLFSEDPKLVPEGFSRRALRGSAGMDVVIVPPQARTPVPEECSPRVATWLRQQAEAGTVLASACVGAFLLAEAGLLEGRRATTHWLRADAFRERYPNVDLVDEEMIVDEGDLVTAGGVTAWLDLALRLVAKFVSPGLAALLGKYYLVDTGLREQRYYRLFQPSYTHGDDAIVRVQRYLLRGYKRDIDNRQLAQVARLSVRTLQRRFTRATGYSPASYVKRLRLQQACERLETTRQSVDEILYDVGYGDSSAFRKMFKGELGLTPTQYRRRFSQR